MFWWRCRPIPFAAFPAASSNFRTEFSHSMFPRKKISTKWIRSYRCHALMNRIHSDKKIFLIDGAEAREFTLDYSWPSIWRRNIFLNISPNLDLDKNSWLKAQVSMMQRSLVHMMNMISFCTSFYLVLIFLKY